ncbi:ATPase domain-containing protein [Vitiosangium sp. GDMCC 1.1324]|uniref:ATPase domain-containing protein n=1 Tax=Vitiosangium sp. (strain GDMCC 1.1324) TaxID=2138576 RepID=UPI000D33DC9F|nr:ATPase domain-containing protein [Vitiosangium sp. GDMCC 1.1324]PTL83365.1 Circadian clock protein KaiC [Vitiosangium sp. GDMCC 1.1324]
MNEAEQSEEPVRRVSTGSSGLDTILHGGWAHGGTYMVTGSPGAGKTILGNQLCFSHVASGGHAVFVTMLSESHERMMTHLRRMHFFRRDVIGQSLHYVSGYATLKAEGLDGLARLLYRSVREHQATVLVVDGLLAVQESVGSALAFREFLHALGVHNALAGCTTLLLTNQQESPADPQFAMVDGVLMLELRGLRAVRTLEVTKLRGEAQLAGKHTFHITDNGLDVYPRLESLPPLPPGPEQPDGKRRLGFGLTRLDEMLGGGLIPRSSTLVFGSPGSGKTLLGLHFLAQGAQQDEPGLYYGFMETSARLVEKAAGVGLQLRPWVDSGRLVLKTRVATETLPDALAYELLGLVEHHRVRRLVIDGLEPLVQETMDSRRIPGFLTALTHRLRSRGVTVLMTQQTHVLFGPRLEAKLEGLEAIVDNIVFLRYVELRSQLYRMLSILKMRESDYEPALREFSISARGIDVAETFESAEAILTGQARPLNMKTRRKKAGRRMPSRRRSRS